MRLYNQRVWYIGIAMGLFTRLTARIHAKSRGRAGIVGSPGYPGEIYGEIRTSVEAAIQGHELLKGQTEEQIIRLENCFSELNTMARKSVKEREDQRASSALYLKILISRELGVLHSQRDSLGAEQAKLAALLETLRLKVNTFVENEKESLADFSPADAVARINESAVGLDEELEAVRYAVDRALEKSARGRTCCEESRRLSTNCSDVTPDLEISDKDQERVKNALASLKSEVNPL